MTDRDLVRQIDRGVEVQEKSMQSIGNEDTSKAPAVQNVLLMVRFLSTTQNVYEKHILTLASHFYPLGTSLAFSTCRILSMRKLPL